MQKPLAEILRPQEFDEVFGQEKIWSKGAPLRMLVEKDSFHSLIFWGPPGTGKTSVANLIGRFSRRPLVVLSAVSTGVKEIRASIQQSEQDVSMGHKSHILFLDEVHRLSKSQQDALLPALEQGWIKFIGATTENPSFEVNHAINSRSLVFRFERISTTALVDLLKSAVSRNVFKKNIDITDEALEMIASSADGDARRAFNLFESLVVLTPEGSSLDREMIEKASESLPLAYDKNGDQHYNNISAMIKSIRASHPDAALYYMARMIDGGEDPKFIARRLLISASEDIGNANPHALNIALSGAEAVHMLGMPEARIILGQVCAFLASSPKSNRSYVAMDKALAAVKRYGSLPVPLHLCNAPTKMMKSFGYGEGYVYAHDDPEGARNLSYLPEKLAGTVFYEPSDSGHEVNIKESLRKLRPVDVKST